MSDNVETEATELKASESRASRMARYSAAAAGVAAVSSIEVDADVIIRDLQTPFYFSGSTFDVSEAGGKPADTFTLLFNPSSWGSNNGGGSEAFVGTFFGLGKSIGPATSGGNWTPGGFMGNNFSSFSEAFLGFRVPKGLSSYNYGFFHVESTGGALNVDYWGYESVANTAVITKASSQSQVPDSGPGIVGLALIGAGAAGVRLLRKLRAGK